MNVFVTLVNTKNKNLQIFNGFSFVRGRVDGVDVFLDQALQSQDEVRMILAGFPRDAKFFCSVSVPSNWFFIEPFVDERWVLGGPLVSALKSGTIVCRGTLVDGHAEEYFGLPYIPSFGYYFEDYAQRSSAESVYICASLGSGCYWGKCRFCSHTMIGFEQFIRAGTDRLLGQIRKVAGKPTTVFFGFSSTPPEILEAMLRSGVHLRVNAKTFVRADESICKVIENEKSLNGFVVVVGAESFSQRINEKLNKGTSWETMLRLIDVVGARGGRVQMDVMEHYPFIDEACLEEADRTISAVERLRLKHGRKSCFVLNFGPTVWYSEEMLSQVCSAWYPHAGLFGEKWFWPLMTREAVSLNARMNNMIETRLGVEHCCPRGQFTARLEEEKP